MQKKKKQEKNTDNKKDQKTARWLSGILTQIFAMIMVGTMLLTSSKYFLYHDYYGIFFNSPFENTDNFYDTGTFQNLFYRDLTGLGFYLACCAQLTTDGEYDETKTVDVFAYQNARNELYPELEEAEDLPKLTYRIGDLIEWVESGFNYYSDDTADGRYSKMEERYRPVNVNSLYELKLPEGVHYQEVAQTVQAAADNIYYNYYEYLKYRHRFNAETNLKYMFVTRENQIAYTNLPNAIRLPLDELENTFMKSEVYLLFDYPAKEQEQKAFESAGIEDGMILAYKTALLDRISNFPEGGTLYVALQTQDSEAFGSLNKNDFYAVTADMYSADNIALPRMMPIITASGILALISLLMFLAFQPKKKPEEMRYFDRWFTELSACFAFATAVILGVTGFLITKVLFCDTQGLTMTRRSNFYVAGGLITFSLLYMMFLYYMGSLVRRIKAGIFWTRSFCYYLLHNVKSICANAGGLTKKVIRIMLNHKSLLVRTFVPYGLFLFLNLAFVVVFEGLGVLMYILLDGLVGVYLYYSNKAREEIVKGISCICDGNVDYQIKTAGLYGENKVIAEAVNRIGQAVKTAVQISMKDERLKADLITNVSHDIKTPLTSIINYVDLLKRENIQGEKAQEYIRILDEKSQRLKQLTVDLVEASKISSGNITLDMEKLDVTELMTQTLGEYEDRLENRKLDVIYSYPPDGERAVIYADSRRMWRILENLFGNICKYAMENTRVYVDVVKGESEVEIILRNISAQPLNIPADELTRRFIRGDISRSTEGSGLGLSIAQNLTTAQNGRFEIYLDGDLFKVSLIFPLHKDNEVL